MTLPKTETPQEALVRLLAKVRWTKTSLAAASGYPLRSVHRWLEYQTTIPVPSHVLDTLRFLANMTEKAEEQFAHFKLSRNTARVRRGDDPPPTHNVADPGFARAMAEIELLKARLANYEKAPPTIREASREAQLCSARNIPYGMQPPPPTPIKPKES